MMYKLLLFLAFVMVYLLPVHAQVIRVNEKDPDGRPFSGINNSDINSTLEIQFDKEMLINKVSKSAGIALPADVITLIDIMKDALAKKKEMLGLVKSTIEQHRSDPGKTTAASIRTFNERMRGLASAITTLLQKDTLLDRYYAEEESFGLFASIYPALQRRINELQSNLLLSNNFKDFSLQVGAWLVQDGKQTPVHLEGFDNYPKGEYYEVQRWRYAPTAEQLKELDDLQQMAKESSIAEADLKVILLDNYVKELGQALKSGFIDSLKKVQAEAPKVVPPATADMIAKAKDLAQKSVGFIQLIEERGNYYLNLKGQTDFSLSKLLGDLTRDISEITRKKKEIQNILNDLRASIESQTSAVKITHADFVKLVNNTLEFAKEELLGPNGLDILNSSSNVAALALQFTDSVKKFALSTDNFPTESSIDLHYTGKRDEGDRIIIKLVVSADKNIISQEIKDIGLYLIAPHLTGTVGVIFAHPLSQTAIQKDFQMAPYYNLLFKGIFGMSQKWKRRSAIPNSLLDFSLGLHVSCPDFNKDDVPELGVGLVVSGLKDYVQAGWAYNLFQSTPYLFFGIRLPVPSMNFGAGGHSTTNVK